MSVRYRDAGVDLSAAEEITARITQRLGNGLFGGFMPVSQLKAYDSPVLVTSIDGIGTKVRLAASLGNVTGLGQDIVHHCVNDIAVHGAQPLFFLDYLACHSLQRGGDLHGGNGVQDPGWDAGRDATRGVPYGGTSDESCPVEQIIDSIASACESLGITLAGGETAEMPLVYPPGHFDIAGAVVGVVEEKDIIDGSTVREGDVLLGLPSSGLHTNGYSLVQHLFEHQGWSDRSNGLSAAAGGRTLPSAVLPYETLPTGRAFRDERPLLRSDAYQCSLPELGTTLGEALLIPHRCYLTEIKSLQATGMVHGLAHITGGGIEGNLQRILPAGMQAIIDLPPLPPLFQYLQDRGIPTEEMRAVFNLGIGLIAVCDPAIRELVIDYPVIGSIQSAQSQRRVLFNDNR